MQVEKLSVPAEIILIDDASRESYRTHNRRTCAGVTYVQLEKNIGRAAIRNRFLHYAQHSYLLFLDCDVVIHRSNFLDTYVQALQHDSVGVVCGGREYPDVKPDRSQRLRWHYGIKRESQPASKRARQPYVSFMTNNFVLRREVFEQIQFDERLTAYGYEDTLFGMALKKHGVPLLHLDNPVLTGDLEVNADFLANTEKAMANLVFISKHNQLAIGLAQEVTVLRIFYRFYAFRRAIAFLFHVLRPLVMFVLKRGWVNLRLFDFYKLGTLSLLFVRADNEENGWKGKSEF
jgi:cellulose synthase/poly-beta-1,6-N-acetylglucosamine synthase-like glycosyltransferase